MAKSGDNIPLSGVESAEMLKKVGVMQACIVTRRVPLLGTQIRGKAWEKVAELLGKPEDIKEKISRIELYNQDALMIDHIYDWLTDSNFFGVRIKKPTQDIIEGIPGVMEQLQGWLVSDTPWANQVLQEQVLGVFDNPKVINFIRKIFGLSLDNLSAQEACSQLIDIGSSSEMVFMKVRFYVLNKALLELPESIFVGTAAGVLDAIFKDVGKKYDVSEIGDEIAAEVTLIQDKIKVLSSDLEQVNEKITVLEADEDIGLSDKRQILEAYEAYNKATQAEIDTWEEYLRPSTSVQGQRVWFKQVLSTLNSVVPKVLGKAIQVSQDQAQQKKLAASSATLVSTGGPKSVFVNKPSSGNESPDTVSRPPSPVGGK